MLFFITFERQKFLGTLYLKKIKGINKQSASAEQN